MIFLCYQFLICPFFANVINLLSTVLSTSPHPTWTGLRLGDMMRTPAKYDT